ncbi:hypothetical protein G7046_g1530 [Stylonectria norvegica]|nr:hypothetical protein G7046_g1530 [Stylonectria norvegica]
MKTFAFFALFTVSVFAGDFGQSCVDENIDPATEVLSASCNVGDGKGTFADTSLDLNKCLGYSDGKIISKSNGNFGVDCNGCYDYRLPDPWYGQIGVTRPWMNCTCSGASAEVAIMLDSTPIKNQYGVLVC